MSKLLRFIGAFIRMWWVYQWVNMDSVVPRHDFDPRRTRIYMLSVAGQIVLKPRSQVHLSKMRDRWVNEMQRVMDSTGFLIRRRVFWGSKFVSQKRAFFILFRRIKKKEKWRLRSYRATMRTRLRSFGYWLLDGTPETVLTFRD